MYLQFYGFSEAPFNVTPDSKFLFLSHRHQEALAAMLFGVQERKGFICLTGEIGCGKTTLCRAMMSQLDPEQVQICVVLNSYLTDLELLKTINEGFGLPASSESKKELIDALNTFLLREYSEGRNVVLVIDEAQNLRPETLEQIRMISNLETENDKLIQMILIGQPELRRTLNLPELEQLNQRITVRYHIDPLSEEEIPEYVRHRLSVAEPQVEIEFTPQAFRMIHHFSRGVPRRINVICDRCLLVAYTQGTFTVDDKVVQQAVGEIRGEMQGFGPVSTARGGAAMPSAGLPVWFQKILTAILMMMVVAGGVMLAFWLQGNNQAYNGLAGPGEYPNEGRLGRGAVAPVATPAPTVTPEAIEPIPTETPTPAPTPEPSPTPAIYENWDLDPNGVIRVQNPRLAEAASYINLVRQWNYDIVLDTFRESTPAEVQSFDMLAMVQADPLNFGAYRTDKLSEALRLDLPVLIRLETAEDFAPWGVITAMRGEILTLFDPVHGLRRARRSNLDPMVSEAIVLYRDRENLTTIEMGEESDRVRDLQLWLGAEGYLDGAADGKFGLQTREAIRRFQRNQGLEPTGVIDEATAAMISNRLNPDRPRLYS